MRLLFSAFQPILVTLSCQNQRHPIETSSHSLQPITGHLSCDSYPAQFNQSLVRFHAEISVIRSKTSTNSLQPITGHLSYDSYSAHSNQSLGRFHAKISLIQLETSTQSLHPNTGQLSCDSQHAASKSETST
jgi:hypothetical protein